MNRPRAFAVFRIVIFKNITLLVINKIRSHFSSAAGFINFLHKNTAAQDLHNYITQKINIQ